MGTATLVVPETPAASAGQLDYVRRLQEGAERAYAVAREARATGWDPSREVEIVFAEDLAARVEAQVELAGIAELVRRLTRELGDRNRELVALELAKRVARGELRKFSSPTEAIDRAVRAGLSVLTEGVLVAPLEGIAKVQLGKNPDGSDYVDLYFAGPIRAAGGTAQAMSVLLADVVRRELGIGRYQPTAAEIERYKEEVPAYKQAQHLQSIPSNEEIERIVRDCPVCINGEGTEDEEVTGHRDLPRVETNKLRGGAVLVLAEGLTQKAKKISGHVRKLGLTGWEFIDAIAAAKEEPEGRDKRPDEIEASDKYLKDLIAGRPVFAHPSRPGGFRLRYGRGRTCGLASTAIHPVTMMLVDEFIAVGTQLKIERPGKGTIATPCGLLEGPSVVLQNGDFIQLNSMEEFRRVRGTVRRITDLGEILIPFGEFAENNAVLPEASWTLEWWEETLRSQGKTDAEIRSADVAAASYAQAVEISRSTGTPLHPRHTLLWHDVTPAELRSLRDAIAANGRTREDELVLDARPEAKETLIALGGHHVERDGKIRVQAAAAALLGGLGLHAAGDCLVPTTGSDAAWAKDRSGARFPALELASELTGAPLKARAITRLGARLGRPEKADVRKMDPPVHGLFPVGEGGGLQRDVEAASQRRSVVVSLARRRCGTCERETWSTRCACGGHTEDIGAPPLDRALNLGEEFQAALHRAGLSRAPDQVKGVRGLVSRTKTPEPLVKAVLRAHHNVFVFKDGTIRFDMTDAPLTHFRPREIGTSLERLRDLGYAHDAQGRELVSLDQVCELRAQDIIPSRLCGDYLARVAHFVDDLLARLYGLEPFYRVNRAPDLVGHLVAGLAPHTSAAVLARIIGFTEAQVCWGHPYYHASKRRNCDGDEDGVLLLLDALLNFSKSYVPDRRGALMDLPLVLSTRIDPREVDKESHNLDVLARYPLAFYEATERHALAKELAPLMGLVESRLGTPAQYEGLGFTHDTPLIHEGPVSSRYKTLGSMEEKMQAQLGLAERLRAVDAGDVAGRVIETHLLPDVIGNLKAFAKQVVRCTKCNEKYRRIPLSGRCSHRNSQGQACGNALTLTVPEAGVRKYLALCGELAGRYPISDYTRQRVLWVQKYVDASFAPDRFRDVNLQEFL